LSGSLSSGDIDPLPIADYDGDMISVIRIGFAILRSDHFWFPHGYPLHGRIRSKGEEARFAAET
jgi:hypothetical protein